MQLGSSGFPFFSSSSSSSFDLSVAKSVVPGRYVQDDNTKKKEAGKMVDGAINKANIRKRLQHRSLLGGHRTTIPYSFTYAVFPVLIRKQAENKIF
jgi:hypothetical protein